MSARDARGPEESAQGLAHVDRGRMIEAFMGLARRLDIAQRIEQTLVLGEHDAHAQPHPGQLAAAGLVLDRLDQSPCDALAARRWQHRQAPEIEIALLELD